MQFKSDIVRKFPYFNDTLKVKSVDGTSLGEIVSTDDQGFVIEKGFFFPKDFRVSYDDIVEVQKDAVIITKHLAELAPWKSEDFFGWASKPSDLESDFLGDHPGLTVSKPRPGSESNGESPGGHPTR